MVLVQCKICLEEYPIREIEAEDLISPCACKGNAQYVHRRCLDLWHQQDKAKYDRCTICNTGYVYEDTKTPLLSEMEFLALMCLVLWLVPYFVLVFYLVHCIRQDERYIWYLNTSKSSSISWQIGMLIADGFVTMGVQVAILLYVITLGRFNPDLTLNGGKGDALDDTRPYQGRSYDGSFCYSVWAFVGLFVACGVIHCFEELYFCLQSRRRTNRKIKDLNKT
jgi:hypothetical protein